MGTYGQTAYGGGVYGADQLTAGGCDPWFADMSVCCPDEVFEDCEDGSPIAAQYPFTDDEYIQMASNILFRRTCNKFPGICSRTVWPCLECRRCGVCCCDREMIRLDSPWPIVNVNQVTIDGEVLDPANYRVDDWRFLVRTDGYRWPSCTSVNDASEAFVVEYSTGRVPPVELVNAAMVLACELKKACNKRLDCRLDPRIKSVARNGVSFSVNDLSALFMHGAFGLPEVDMVVSQYDCSRRPLRVSHPVFDRGGHFHADTGGRPWH